MAVITRIVLSILTITLCLVSPAIALTEPYLAKGSLFLRTLFTPFSNLKSNTDFPFIFTENELGYKGKQEVKNKNTIFFEDANNYLLVKQTRKII